MWKRSITMAVLMLPAAAGVQAQSAQFGIDWKHVTSYSDGWFTEDAVGQSVRMRGYSLFTAGTTKFVWFLQHQESNGVPVDGFASWPYILATQFNFEPGTGAFAFVGNVNSPWTSFAPRILHLPPDIIPPLNGYEFDFSSAPSFYGCTLPPALGVAFVQTCPEQGMDGWLRFEADALGRLTLDQIEGNMRPADVNVTPEPVTMLLLGSGLAGVGAAARRRRRPKERAKA